MPSKKIYFYCQSLSIRRIIFLLKFKSMIRILQYFFQRFHFFLLSGFSLTDTVDSQDSKGREGTVFYSPLPLPPAHEHPDIYFAHLHVRWLSHTSYRTGCIYQAATRWNLPPYRITICLIDDVMLVFISLLVDLIQGFCYGYLTLETGGLELASTIILVLRANRLTKCSSHPQISH